MVRRQQDDAAASDRCDVVAAVIAFGAKKLKKPSCQGSDYNNVIVNNLIAPRANSKRTNRSKSLSTTQDVNRSSPKECDGGADSRSGGSDNTVMRAVTNMGTRRFVILVRAF